MNNKPRCRKNIPFPVLLIATVVACAAELVRREMMKEEFILRHADNGVWYGVFSHFEKHGLIHGISTRLHGYSDHPFNSLNLGLHTGDIRETVLRNRYLFANAVGINPEAVVTAQQVHEDTITVVTASDKGLGAKDYSKAYSSTDALITAETGVPLMLFFADCVPVLFFDPVRRIIAISHAGWKGTVARIAAKTLTKLQAEFAVNPRDCLIGIGPSIGQCCYEVDETVIDRLRQEFSDTWSDFVSPKKNRWQLNLWEVNRRQLLDVGANEDNIVVSGICTSCNTQLYYSHRAEHGATGRLGAVVQL
jgi:YfiH family protein